MSVVSSNEQRSRCGGLGCFGGRGCIMVYRLARRAVGNIRNIFRRRRRETIETAVEESRDPVPPTPPPCSLPPLPIARNERRLVPWAVSRGIPNEPMLFMGPVNEGERAAQHPVEPYIIFIPRDADPAFDNRVDDKADEIYDTLRPHEPSLEDIFTTYLLPRSYPTEQEYLSIGAFDSPPYDDAPDITRYDDAPYNDGPYDDAPYDDDASGFSTPPGTPSSPRYYASQSLATRRARVVMLRRRINYRVGRRLVYGPYY